MKVIIYNFYFFIAALASVFISAFRVSLTLLFLMSRN
jgi:hypothetical protein